MQGIRGFSLFASRAGAVAIEKVLLESRVERGFGGWGCITFSITEKIRTGDGPREISHGANWAVSGTLKSGAHIRSSSGQRWRV